jgi:P22 tail accessory factor
MGYTRRDIIDAALAEIGYANFAFDMQAEQLEAIKRRLDAMFAAWNAMGLRLSFPIPSSPENSELSDETAIPDSAWEAAITNLAVRIAPMFGKTVSPDTKRTAKMALNTLMSLAAMPGEMQFPGTLPLGSGNKGWRSYENFFPEPEEPLLTGEDGELEFD